MERCIARAKGEGLPCKTRAPHGDCLVLLEAFSRMAWRAPAWALNRLGMLSERARISDLRARWGIEIVAHSHWVRGRKHTIYELRAASRARARALIHDGRSLLTAKDAKSAKKATGGKAAVSPISVPSVSSVAEEKL